MRTEQIALRCEDGSESVVFSKYTFKIMCNNPDETGIKEESNYEITIEDSYIGGDYKGFFGRIKRAWKAFWDKPVVYTGIYCEDKGNMKQFLISCLDILEEA
jgi:hypothetical protein